MSDGTNKSTIPLEIKELANSPSYSTMFEVESSPDCTRLINEFEEYKQKVRDGHLGKSAQFWLAYCDSVWELLHFQRAIKRLS